MADEIEKKEVKYGRPKKKRVGRPKQKDYETTRGSFIIPADVHLKLSRLARHKGLSFNDYLCKILSNFVEKNTSVLKILDETDKKIAELEKGGDDVG